MSTTTPASAYAVALVRAAGLLQHEARKHEEAARELESEGYDERCDETHMHIVEAQCLRGMAEQILDLPNPYGPAPTVPAAPEPDIAF